MKPAAPPTASRAGAYEALLKEQPLAPALIQPTPVVTHGGLPWWERHAIGGWLAFVAFGIAMMVACILMMAAMAFSLITLMLVTVGGLIAMLIQPLRRRLSRAS